MVLLEVTLLLRVRIDYGCSEIATIRIAKHKEQTFYI